MVGSNNYIYGAAGGGLYSEKRNLDKKLKYSDYKDDADLTFQSEAMEFLIKKWVIFL